MSTSLQAGSQSYEDKILEILSLWKKGVSFFACGQIVLRNLI